MSGQGRVGHLRDPFRRADTVSKQTFLRKRVRSQILPLLSPTPCDVCSLCVSPSPTSICRVTEPGVLFSLEGLPSTNEPRQWDRGAAGRPDLSCR